MLGLIALRLRKAALDLLVSGVCDVPQPLTSAIMLFAEAHRNSPEMAIYDPQMAAEMGCSYAFRRLNGDTITISTRSGADTDAVVRYYDQDEVLRHEWVYASEDKALRAVHAWRISTEDAPPPEVVVDRHRGVRRSLQHINPRRTPS